MTERTLATSRVPTSRALDAPRGKPGLALAVILTCQLMLVLDVTVMNVALPHIQTDLHFTSANLSWVMNAYTLVFGGLLLLGGRAGDLLGRRRMFVLGITVFTLSSLAGGLASSAALLLAARVAQGLGAALAGPNTLALITTTIPDPARRVRALALFAGMSTGGFAIGLLLGGVLTELGSWRWVLFINVPFGIAVALLARRYVRTPERHPGALDLPGAITATAGVAALVYAFIRAAGDGWADPVVLATLLGGVLSLAAFVLVELRARQPLLPMWLFADRTRAAAYGNYFLGPMAMMSMFFFLTQYLQDVLKFTPLATGFAFLPMAAAMFGMTRLVPRLLARLGAKTMAVTGSVLMIGGLVWLTQVGEHSGYAAGLLGPMVLIGLGGGLGFAPLNVLIMATVPVTNAGSAGGALQTVQQIGGTLGLAVLVTVSGAAVRGVTGTPAHVLVTGMTSAFVVSACFAAITLAVALTLPRRQTR